MDSITRTLCGSFFASVLFLANFPDLSGTILQTVRGFDTCSFDRDFKEMNRNVSSLFTCLHDV